MVQHAIETLIAAGVDEVMIVTGGHHVGEFLRLFGNGREVGLKSLAFGYQDNPGGIAEALAEAEGFVNGKPVVVMLADNIFERPVNHMVKAFRKNPHGARVLLSAVSDPAHLLHLGVPEIDLNNKIINIIEKPKKPPSIFGVTGVYCYDANVFEIVKTLKPSDRGELEITDVNNHYISIGAMEYDIVDGFWGDAGESIDAYYAVNDFVRSKSVSCS
jgi:glucose-1-phosphate thymidylyltransferase